MIYLVIAYIPGVLKSYTEVWAFPFPQCKQDNQVICKKDVFLFVSLFPFLFNLMRNSEDTFPCHLIFFTA